MKIETVIKLTIQDKELVLTKDEAIELYNALKVAMDIKNAIITMPYPDYKKWPDANPWDVPPPIIS